MSRADHLEEAVHTAVFNLWVLRLCHPQGDPAVRAAEVAVRTATADYRAALDALWRPFIEWSAQTRSHGCDGA